MLTLLVLGLLVAQSTTPGNINWDQIGAGSLIALPAYIAVLALARAYFNSNKARLEREVEISKTVVPLLAQVADVLAQTPHAVERALADAQGAAKAHEMDKLMDRINTALSKFPENK